MITLNSTILSEIETMFFPAVFALVNEDTKTVWISRTKCLADGLLRATKNIKEGNHKIDSLDKWKPLCLYSGENLLYNYSRVCREYRERGYKLLNRQVKYSLKKKIKKNDAGKYVSIVTLSTRNYDLKVLGEFKTDQESSEFIKEWLKTNSI